MSNRYDSASYVAEWERDGQYPRIHDGISAWVREHVGPAEAGTVLDLCASTGLLGRRLAELGYRVAAVEQPGVALAVGQDAGVYDRVPVLPLRIRPDTLPDLAVWLREQQVRTVVARRALPELWDALGAVDFGILGGILADAGVTTILGEGRVSSARSTHVLATAALEAAALGGSWAVDEVRGAFYLLIRAGVATA